MARECTENDYGMCTKETGLLHSDGAQSVRQRSNIEYFIHPQNALSPRVIEMENVVFARLLR